MGHTRFLRALSRSFLSCSQIHTSRRRQLFGPVRYVSECIRGIVGDSRSALCLGAEIWQRCPSLIDWSAVNLSIYSSQCCDYSSRMTIDLCQSVFFWFWDVEGDNSYSVFMVNTTIGSSCSSCDDFCGASVLTIVDISSFSRPGILCLLKCCCFVEVLVSRMKNGRLGIASKMLFPGRHPFVTRLRSGSKYCRPFFSFYSWLTLQKRVQATSAWQLELCAGLLLSILGRVLPLNESSCPHSTYFLF